METVPFRLSRFGCSAGGCEDLFASCKAHPGSESTDWPRVRGKRNSISCSRRGYADSRRAMQRCFENNMELRRPLMLTYCAGLAAIGCTPFKMTRHLTCSSTVVATNASYNSTTLCLPSKCIAVREEYSMPWQEEMATLTQLLKTIRREEKDSRNVIDDWNPPQRGTRTT